MNKFLQSESVAQTVSEMNTHKKAELMDYETELQKKGGGEVDFNLNNITTDTVKPNRSDQIVKQANSFRNQPLNRSQSKAIDIEQLKRSSKSKSKRILKRIDKLKAKHCCTDQDAISMMIRSRKSNKIINSRLSLEEHLAQEDGLKNQLKVSRILLRVCTRSH